MAVFDTSIISLLLDQITEHLVETCMTEVADDTQAGILREGRLLDDPSIGRINILVRTDPDEPHELYVNQDGFETPTFGFGAGRTDSWLRKFFVEVNIFIDDADTYNDASDIAFSTLARIEYNLNTLPFSGLRDSFGEVANWIQVRKTQLRHQGGDDTWLFPGFVRVQVMTEKHYLL